MIDIKILRETPAMIEEALRNRNYPEDAHKTLSELLALDKQWRAVKKEEELLRAERNKLSQLINENKKAARDASADIGRSGEVARRIKEITVETQTLEDQIKAQMLFIPNIPDYSVPLGKDENSNPERRVWGQGGKGSKDIIPHDALGERSGFIDFERGVKLAEHRFSILSGPVAKLERALINFMLSVHTSRGYREYATPYLVNSKAMTGTGQLPKFKEDLYKCADDDLWLIPTAEVPLTNMFSGEVLDEKHLPLKITAFTPSFRREAGAYGKDIKGLIRQHQFDKVELVRFSKPENSLDELESLTKDAEHILQLLGLPYRVIELCTGDLGFSSAKTYDLEVWLPSQDKYREISSCSMFSDFQARRANIRFRGPRGPEYVHTLNGSGLAVGRTLVAILENFQEDKKTVVIPKPLRDFMGAETIGF